MLPSVPIWPFGLVSLQCLLEAVLHNGSVFFHHSLNPLVLRLRHAHLLFLLFSHRTSVSFLIALFKSQIGWILCSSMFSPSFLMLHFLKCESYLQQLAAVLPQMAAYFSYRILFILKHILALGEPTNLFLISSCLHIQILEILLSLKSSREIILEFRWMSFALSVKFKAYFKWVSIVVNGLSSMELAICWMKIIIGVMIDISAHK